MSLEDALIDLYLNVKVRKQDDIDNMNTDAIKEEKENLKKLNPIRILDYIRNSIDILIDVKVEERLEQLNVETKDTVDKMNEYEPLLKKLESDIRQHIKMEHQLKLHSDTLQSRVEELEIENIELHRRNKTLSDTVNQFSNSKSYDSSKDKKDSEISQLKSEIHNMNQIIKSYEDQSVKMSEIEKKMKNINAKHEKEIKNLEEKYHEKMKVFSKKLLKYEEITKTASSFRTSRKEEDEEDKHDTSAKLYTTNKYNVPYKQITQRSSKSPVSTDRKKDGVSLKDRIDQYRKLIDKNLQEISQSNPASSNKGINKSGLLEGSHNRTNSSHSLLTKEKAEMNVNVTNTKNSHKRNDSLIKNLDKATKNILTKENFKIKSHNRNCSMEIKQVSVENKLLNKSPVSGSNKNIHAMKEILLNNNKQHKIPRPLHQRQASINNPGSNIILNQGGNPCINQITIYATNNPNANQIKPNDLNLRNIINKTTNTRNNSKTAAKGHVRNPSKNNI